MTKRRGLTEKSVQRGETKGGGGGQPGAKKNTKEKGGKKTVGITGKKKG